MAQHLEDGTGSRTAGRSYAERLSRLETAPWKRWLDVQRPYRWNLRRLQLGDVLDVGCGIGRNLVNLGGGVGVDHNAESVDTARRRGLTAYTTTEFAHCPDAVERRYDTLLLAHVLEHLGTDVADDLVRAYLPYLRPGGRVLFITPQEAGFRTDDTHVRFVDTAGLREHADRLGLDVERSYSFPLPRAAGRLFPYNEFVLLARYAG